MSVRLLFFFFTFYVHHLIKITMFKKSKKFFKGFYL